MRILLILSAIAVILALAQMNQNNGDMRRAINNANGVIIKL